MNDPGRFAARSDGQAVEPEADAKAAVLEHSRAPERMAADKVRCEACPVLCQISPGKLGACDRYGNVDGTLTRLDTLHLVARPGVDLVAWRAAEEGGWDGYCMFNPADTTNDATRVIPAGTLNPSPTWSQHRYRPVNYGATASVFRPKTQGNITYGHLANDGLSLFPDMAVDKLKPRGATFVVCNVAHTVVSGMLGQKAGVAPDVARAEFEKGLIPGFMLVPSGVLAVHRAQEKGKCSYCYAG
jgi:intracellular sulfur oxidation DsrE/DsrF family protein